MGIATTVLAGRSRDRIPLGERNFYLFQGVQIGSGAQWIEAFCPRGKLDGREANR